MNAAAIRKPKCHPPEDVWGLREEARRWVYGVDLANQTKWLGVSFRDGVVYQQDYADRR